MSYADMCEYVKVYDLVCNKVSLINQVLGCRYDFDCHNPCVLMHVGGRWRVVLFGRVLAEWAPWDVSGVRAALSFAQVAFDVLWDARRVGFVKHVQSLVYGAV